MKFQILIVLLTMLDLIESQGCEFKNRKEPSKIGKGDCHDGYCTGGCGNETKMLSYLRHCLKKVQYIKFKKLKIPIKFKIKRFTYF